MITDTVVIFLIFENMFPYFWMITWIKSVNDFQMAKTQSKGVA